MKPTLLLIFLLCFAFPLKSQSIYPQNYFRSPIDFRILLSGSFGELRSDHFHTGIDIKTRGVESASVYAVSDGYVSRVKISAFGTGKTIYLTHSNGFVSVYGHLSKLEDSLASFIKAKQYQQKSFEVDYFPNQDQFRYKKGDLIALSGNSGSSGGPHLHFEIRDERTQEPLNPLLFGIEVKDFIRPEIQSIRVYPNGKKPFNLDLAGWGEGYHLKVGDTIAMPKSFYLGISTNDKQNDTQNKNGVFEVELYLDSSKVYSNRQERLDFATGRFINTFIDYPYFINNNRRYQKSFVGLNNKLKIYGDVKNNGLINIEDTGIHQLIYQVSDAKGNISKLKFYFYVADDNKFESTPDDKIKKAIFYANKDNDFSEENLKLSIPENALYDSLYFHFEVLPSNKNTFSPIYRLHQKDVALNSFIKLSIEVDKIPAKLKSKLLIARLDKDKYTTHTIKWQNNWASVSVRSFGDYTIIADTVQPQIKFINSSKLANFKTDSKISFIIKDDLSGIKEYRGYLNDEWVLFEYDAKNNLIFHQIESSRLKEENKLKIEVFDWVGNSAVFERTFKKE